MKKFNIFIIILFVLAFAYTDPAKAWSGGDCPLDDARKENKKADEKLNEEIQAEIDALDALLKAEIGENWQEILDKTSDRDLLGDRGKLGKGLGKINGKHFLESNKEQELRAKISEEGADTIDNVVDYFISNGDSFVPLGSALSGQAVEEISNKRKELYRYNLTTLYGEAVRTRSAIAGNVFNDKINMVLDDYLKIDGGAEVSLAEVWRANAAASIIQAEILLSLVELETQELRTSVLRDMIELPVRLNEALGDKVQTVDDTDVTSSREIKKDEVDDYVDKLIRQDNFNFWNK